MNWNKKLMIAVIVSIVLSLFNESGDLFAQSRVFPKINTLAPATHKKKPSSRYHTTERKINYLGRLSDSLTFSDNSMPLVQIYKSQNSMRSVNEPGYADSGLVITIDTNQLVVANEKSVVARGTTSVQTYEAYPVLIQNITTQPLIVGTGNSVPVVIEALDAGSNWRTVEGPLSFSRNISEDNIILQPGDVVGVAVPVYSGSFQTLVRIRVFNNYSEPFTGFLNPIQLVTPVQ